MPGVMALGGNSSRSRASPRNRNGARVVDEIARRGDRARHRGREDCGRRACASTTRSSPSTGHPHRSAHSATVDFPAPVGPSASMQPSSTDKCRRVEHVAIVRRQEVCHGEREHRSERRTEVGCVADDDDPIRRHAGHEPAIAAHVDEAGSFASDLVRAVTRPLDPGSGAVLEPDLGARRTGCRCTRRAPWTPLPRPEPRSAAQTRVATPARSIT